MENRYRCACCHQIVRDTVGYNLHMADLKEIRALFKSKRGIGDQVFLIGDLIDKAEDDGDLPLLDYVIKKATTLLDKKKVPSSQHKALLYYFLGNAWQVARYLPKNQPIQQKLLSLRDKPDASLKELALFSYRNAIAEEEFQDMSDIAQAQMLVNLGNLLSNSGRAIEAIPYWERAMDTRPGMTMAQGNLAHGLVAYSQLLYDPGHQHAFLYKAKSLYDTLEQDQLVHPKAWKFFQEQRARLADFDGSDIDWENFDMGKNEENEYRIWCARNRLFLNPLNDLEQKPLAARDPFHLPSIVTAIGTGPKYQGMYNQLKQEFVASRFTLYQGVEGEETHFSDREVQLVLIYDYPAYSLNVERVRMSYRSAFSIINKIAFFLNDYFELSIPEGSVDYTTVLEKLESNGHMKENWQLQALDWIGRDIFNQGYEKFLDEETRLIREIRNHLEHKYLKILDMGTNTGRIENQDELTDDLSFNVPRSVFNSKAVRLFQIVRAALIHLSLAIRMDQLIKERNRDKSSIIPPMYLGGIDDSWKR